MGVERSIFFVSRKPCNCSHRWKFREASISPLTRMMILIPDGKATGCQAWQGTKIMSNDTFTTTTNQSWFGRIGGAFTGVLVGILLFLGSFVLLSWNEGRAIHRAKTLELGAKQVVSLSSDEPDSANEGKLVHLTGTAEAADPVTDALFEISADALRLRRDVEMYQWKETEKSETKQKLGGGEETTKTYSYSKDWSSQLIDSTQFQKPDGHSNPDAFPVESETFAAEGIHVGKFDLPESLTEMINNFSARPVTAEEAKAASNAQAEEMYVTQHGQLYVGENPKTPAIGDLRITYQVAPTGPVSIIARQIEGTFEPFTVPKLGSIELLQCGTVSADTMFRQEQEGNAILTWILRLAGFLMMLFGLLLISNLFSVLASVIPFLGGIVGAGTGFLCFVAAVPLTLVTIALAWLAYRPLIGIPLVLLAAGSVVFGVMQLSRLRKKKTPA